jgi:hypothetical protein
MRALVSMLRPDATADSTNEVDNACARLRRSFAEIRACRGEKSTRRRGEGRAGIWVPRPGFEDSYGWGHQI